MADRIPQQYPMFSQNLMQNSIQQQQIPQSSQQPQQADAQMISGLSNPEHSRLWQPMNQLPNQYRGQQSGDMPANQMNHQMSDFARAQTVSHGQGQQPMVQQLQSFGLNAAQRMNASGPSFHDPQASQSQSLIPPHFANMPMNTQQLKPGPNRNAIMQAAMNNPRQVQLMVNQNQQAPNAIDLARLQQVGLGAQHGANQPSAADMFAASTVAPNQDQMHGSPHPAPQPGGPSNGTQGMMSSNSQIQNGQRRPTTFPDYEERRAFLQGAIQQMERNIAQMQQAARTGNVPDHLWQPKMNNLRAELAHRKELYAKHFGGMAAFVQPQVSNGMVPANVAHQNLFSAPQPHQQLAATVQGQSGFMAQTNSAPGHSFGMSLSANGQPLPPHSQAQTSLNQPMSSQSGQIGRQNPVPPRPAPTPHQLPNAVSPLIGNQFSAMQVANGQMLPNQMRPSPSIKPLDKQRFETTYTHFCKSQLMEPSMQVPIAENRTVDLHELHVQVLREGGAMSVTYRDLWPVIGGRMGFVQFPGIPGSESDPPRSGPGIAQQLQLTYAKYHQQFENAYFQAEKSRNAAGLKTMNAMASSSGAKAPALSSNPSETQPNANAPRANAQALNNAHLMLLAARYVHLSVADMRAQGVNENLMNMVDRHRGDIIRWSQTPQAQLIAKRYAEQAQEQQNLANAQGQISTIHDQMSTGVPPVVQRSQQQMGPNTTQMSAGEQQPMGGQFQPGVPPNTSKPANEQQVINAIENLKNTFAQRLANMPWQIVPDEQRAEFNELLEQVSKMASDMNNNLALYYTVLKDDDALRKSIAIVLTVAKQRHLLSTSQPQYIIAYPALRIMQMQLQRINDDFNTKWRQLRTAQAGVRAPHLAAPPVPLPIPPPVQNAHQQPTAAPMQVSLNATPAPPPPPPQPQLTKKPSQPIPPSPSALPASTNTASPTPPPVASISTPAPSTSTPQTQTTASPTPRSPKVKAPARPKPPPRTRKSSMTTKGPISDAAPPTVAGVKRPPEDDVSHLSAAGPSETGSSNAPSPKKVKTEWEGETSEALLKKRQEVENIKTDEEAAAFFDRVKELLAMTPSTDNDINSDIASTLDQMLAGVPQEPADAASTAAALSAHGTGDTGPPPTALSPHQGPLNDALLEFFDFSSYTNLEDEDSDSKAPTPELVPSSDTNLSPASGSEGEVPGGASSPDKTKVEDPVDHLDLLRLGSLREIDGGESAYYQTENWKWEGAMTTLDQPWAIFTSS
ncbi:hypothetical protein F5I97DRAFT_1475989 [Phlebopus sp. FC_14]|nr:hypothetical protein F5I97DRAFT_1475989 [Phlebopus sp. FC_14]